MYRCWVRSTQIAVLVVVVFSTPAYCVIDTISVLPQAPYTSDGVIIELIGWSPCLGWEIDSVVFGQVANSFTMDVLAIRPPGICMPVSFQYRRSYAVGPLPQGTYSVVAREWEIEDGQGPPSHGNPSDADTVWFVVSTVAGVLDESTATSSAGGVGLSQNFPNPFNTNTAIEFRIGNQSDWVLTVHNILGQIVRSYSGSSITGPIRIAWDGTNEDGSPVPSGVYFYRVMTPTWSETKKMTLLK